MSETRRFPVFVKLSKLQAPGTPSKIFNPDLAPEDVLHQLVVSAAPDQTVQSVIDQAKETLEKGFKYRFEFAYISAITIRGFVFDPKLKVADFFAPDRQLADRTITIYQNRLDRQATIPAGSNLRPPKRELGELSEDEQRHFKRFKLAHDGDCGLDGSEVVDDHTLPCTQGVVTAAPRLQSESRRDADGFLVPPRPVRDNQAALTDADHDTAGSTNVPLERGTTSIPTPESPRDEPTGAGRPGHERSARRETPPSAQRPRNRPASQEIPTSAQRPRAPSPDQLEQVAPPNSQDSLVQAGYATEGDGLDGGMSVDEDGVQMSTLLVSDIAEQQIANDIAHPEDCTHAMPNQFDDRPTSRHNNPVRSAFSLMQSSQTERVSDSSPADRARVRQIGAAARLSSVRNSSTQTPSSGKGTPGSSRRADNFLSGPWTMDETKKLAKALREGISCTEALKKYSIQRNPSGARNRKKWILKHRPDMLAPRYVEEDRSPQLAQRTLQLAPSSQTDGARTSRGSVEGQVTCSDALSPARHYACTNRTAADPVDISSIADDLELGVATPVEVGLRSSPAVVVSRNGKEVSIGVDVQWDSNRASTLSGRRSEQQPNGPESRNGQQDGKSRQIRPFRRSSNAARRRRLMMEDRQDNTSEAGNQVAPINDALHTINDRAACAAEQRAANEQIIRETEESHVVPGTQIPRTQFRSDDAAPEIDQIMHERYSSELGQTHDEIDAETLARYQALANMQLRRMSDEESEDFYHDMQELARQTSIDLHGQPNAPSSPGNFQDVDERRPDWIHAKTTDDQIRNRVDSDVANRQAREIHYNINRYYRDLLRLECDGGHQTTADQIKNKIYRHRLQLLGIDEGLPLEVEPAPQRGHSEEPRHPVSRPLEAVILLSSSADYESAVENFSDDNVTEPDATVSTADDARSVIAKEFLSNGQLGKESRAALAISSSAQLMHMDSEDSDMSDREVPTATIPGWKPEDDLPDAPTQVPVQKDVVGPVVAEVDDDGNYLSSEPQETPRRNRVMDSIRASFPAPKLVPCEAELQKQREELMAQGFSQGRLREQYTVRRVDLDEESIPAEIPAVQERREREEAAMRAQKAQARQRRSQGAEPGSLQHSINGTAPTQARPDNQKRAQAVNAADISRPSVTNKQQPQPFHDKDAEDDLRILEVRPLGGSNGRGNRNSARRDALTIGSYNQRVRASQRAQPQSKSNDPDGDLHTVEVRDLAFAPTRGVRVRRSSIISSTRRAQQAARSASRSVEPSVVITESSSLRQQLATRPEADRQREITRMMISTPGFKAEMDRINQDRAQVAAERRRQREKAFQPAQTGVNGELGVAAQSSGQPASALEALRSRHEARSSAQAASVETGSANTEVAKEESTFSTPGTERRANVIAHESIAGTRTSDDPKGKNDDEVEYDAMEVEETETLVRTATFEDKVGTASTMMEATTTIVPPLDGEHDDVIEPGNDQVSSSSDSSDNNEESATPSSGQSRSREGSTVPDEKEGEDTPIADSDAEDAETAGAASDAIMSESTATPDDDEPSASRRRRRGRQSKPRFSSISLASAAALPSKFLRDHIRYGRVAAASK